MPASRRAICSASRWMDDSCVSVRIDSCKDLDPLSDKIFVMCIAQMGVTRIGRCQDQFSLNSLLSLADRPPVRCRLSSLFSPKWKTSPLGVNSCKTCPFPRPPYVVPGDLPAVRLHSNPEFLPMNLFEHGHESEKIHPGSICHDIDAQTSVNICVPASYIAGISCACCLVKWR